MLSRTEFVRAAFLALASNKDWAIWALGLRRRFGNPTCEAARLDHFLIMHDYARDQDRTRGGDRKDELCPIPTPESWAAATELYRKDCLSRNAEVLEDPFPADNAEVGSVDYVWMVEHGGIVDIRRDGFRGRLYPDGVIDIQGRGQIASRSFGQVAELVEFVALADDILANEGVEETLSSKESFARHLFNHA